MARKTLNDVIEQLKVNNETTVDINTGIAGLENQFGKFFADLKRQRLEDSREAKAARAVNVAPMQKSQSSSGGGGFRLPSLKGLAGIGALLGVVLPFAAKKIGVGIAAAGVGIAAFFTGLAGAEAIIRKFIGDDAGKGLKELLKNLSEGLGAFSRKSFIALGTVLAAGIIFPKNTALGLGAVGLGLGAFITALAGSDKLIQMMNGDGGENVKRLLKNLAEGLEPFSTKSFIALGAAMAAGSLLALFPGGAVAATAGIAGVGLGIGAFLLALGGVSKFASLFGIDGSALKVLLKNMAEGLNELTAIEETDKLLKRLAGIGLVGPAVLAAITSFTAAQGVDALINGAKKVINFITFGAAGLEDQATARKGMIRNLVDAMKPLQEIPTDLGNQLDLLSSSLLNFVRSFNKATDDLDVDKISETFLKLGTTLSMTRNLVYSMANGGEFKKPGFMNKIAQTLGLGGTIEFGKEGSGGLLDPALKTDDLVKQVEKIHFVLGKTNVAPTIAPPIAPTNYPDRIQNMNGGGAAVVNSGNTTNNVSNNQGIVMPKGKATDGSDSLTNQITPSFAAF